MVLSDTFTRSYKARGYPKICIPVTLGAYTNLDPMK